MADGPTTDGVQEPEGAPETQRVVSFFKPQSPFAKDNKRLITILALIWAVAVFGFQILLILFQSPTPEPIHGEFKKVWAQVESGKASAAENKIFARATLRVLGKNIAVQDGHKATLKTGLHAAVSNLLPANQRDAFSKAAAGDAPKAAAMAKKAIGLEDKGFDKLMAGLLPYSMVASGDIASVKGAIPGIMDLYLIHNQSFLTDFNFMGFPFHYWFTGQFLLIMFVLLCLAYARLIDKVMIKHGRMTADKS
jgi:putative solute:sodium symporter small subunit